MKHLPNHFLCSAVIVIFLSASSLSSCADKPKTENAPKLASATSEQVENSSSADNAEMGKAPAIQQDSDTIIASTSSEKPQKKASLTPVYMGMWGNVGGTGFTFDMDGTKGSYIPYDIAEAKEYGERRQLELVSYDTKSGKCVINAFLRGAYIGQFDGIFQEEEEKDEGGSHYWQAYEGVFTSVKGAKLNFHFHFD